jgi:hypothetical protein
MDWTINLIVQVVAGFAGAHLAATALHEYRFGWIGHSLVGLIAGALSGYFLQAIVLTVVNGGGGINKPTIAETVVIEALTGAVVGIIATAAVGFLVKENAAKI